jgi:hypothetical protein
MGGEHMVEGGPNVADGIDQGPIEVEDQGAQNRGGAGGSVLIARGPRATRP